MRVYEIENELRETNVAKWTPGVSQCNKDKPRKDTHTKQNIRLK